MASAPDLPKLYQGVQKQSFGYKMLSTMGWTEGQGLGANNQGIKEHIKVKKKQDAFGVGAAEQAHKLRDWTTGMVGYDAILSGLKEITRGSSTPDSNDSSSNGDSSSRGHSSGYDSDSDTSSDAVAARAPAKKNKKRGASGDKGTKRDSKAAKAGDDSKKKKRKQQADAEVAPAKRHKQASKGKAAASSDSSSRSSDSSDAEGEPAATTAAAAAAGAGGGAIRVSRVKAATHIGRYAKRERAKTVRNYSATDLAAILGLPSSAPVVQGGEGADAWAAAAAAAGINTGAQAQSSSSGDGSSSSDDGSSSSDSDSDSRQGSEQRLRPGTPPGSDTPPSRVQQGLSGAAEAADVPVAVAVDAADAKAWWRGVFVKCGGSGSSLGLRPGSKAINAHGFLEDDQTNLYMQAHATATTGKQGLGRSTLPKKVAGARWQGTKTKLGSDDEDDDEQAQQQQQQQDAAADSLTAAAAAAGREQYVKNGIVIILPVKKQPAGADTAVQQQQQHGNAIKKKSKQKAGQAAAAAVLTAQHADAATPAAAGRKKRKQQKQQAAAGGSSKKSKRQADVCSEPGAAAAAAAGEAAPKSVKWAKLAAKVLEGAPKRRMRIQKLHKKVVAAAGYDVSAPGVDTEALYQQVLKKLRKAQGLEVCEKYVGLSAQ